jgi:lipid-A-disaccharide synthase
METLGFLRRERPDALVLIDYPGFNVRLAEKAHGEKIKVIYYISPQVWAWAKERVKRLGQVIEKMLVVFSFEEEIYRREGVPVKFVGHPLLDELEVPPSPEEIRRLFGLKPGELTVALLPGSRLQEIKLILPVMLETALLLKEKFKVTFLLPVAPAINREVIEKEISRYALPLKIVEGESIKVITASDLVITASGTATLETAILGRPMVIVYKVPFLSYLVLKRLIKVPYIGMVNILLKEKIFPEFIQYEARADNIFKACSRILEDQPYREKMLNSLSKIGDLLGGPGGSLRAAQEIWGIAYGHS